MATSFTKETLRSITHSLGRFLAIAAIVALGTGFYAGLRMTEPNMNRAADEFFDATGLMDIRVLSTLGLTDEDIESLREVDGVEAVMPAYETDAMVQLGEEQYAMRIHSLPDAAASSDTSDGVSSTSSDPDYLNRPILIEGAWPQSAGECVLSEDLLIGVEKNIGDTIVIVETIEGREDDLVEQAYTVVGMVNAPYYATNSFLGSTSLGAGHIEEVMYVSESDFSADLPYTEAFITVQGASEELYSSGEYEAVVSQVVNSITEIAPSREQARLDELQEQAQQELEASVAQSAQSPLDSSFDPSVAQAQFEEAQQRIDDMEKPEWLIMDRFTNYGAASFLADAERVDSIAQVFPFIFFLVAALVALTTMTRMIDEERGLIGTFKALGYRRFRIASKYVIYAAIASGAGSIVGIVLLSQALPAIVMEAYSIIYMVPPLVFPLPIDPFFASLSAGMGVGATIIATLGAAGATLREKPALLMLPRVPKAGKRILLERITPLWSRVSFTWKVTFRNLFRYKKRFIMTVVGIAGCTALLLTGLGLSDAINDIVDKQYGELEKSNATITIDENISPEDWAQVEEVLSNKELVNDYTVVMRQNILISGEDGVSQNAIVVVPEDESSYAEFFNLKTRSDDASVEFDKDSLLLAEKLAAVTNTSTGDTITFTEQDAIGNATKTSYTAGVTGIFENYINYYAFMGSDLYTELVGQEPVYTTIMLEATTDADLRTHLSEELHDVAGVETIAYVDDVVSMYKDMLSSVNMIVVVLVVAAAALAFIVLYNLTNINITERIREIATLKVLGFTSREMNSYIFREIFLLTIIGCFVGLGLGVWMEGFIVVTAEVDQIMFGREIHITSYVGAFFLTMLFSFVVMLVMQRKLSRIDMVESLKSNE